MRFAKRLIVSGYQVKGAIDAPDDWKTQIDRPNHTTTRRTYKLPVQHPALAETTTRYGCNKSKHVPALGAGIVNRVLRLLLLCCGAARLMCIVYVSEG